jgi:hypothetical protein
LVARVRSVCWNPPAFSSLPLDNSFLHDFILTWNHDDWVYLLSLSLLGLDSGFLGVFGVLSLVVIVTGFAA